MSDSSSRVGMMVVIVVAVLIAAGALAWFSLQPGPIDDDGDGGPDESGEAATFIELRNKGIGWLENKDFVEAENTFEALHEALPDELLPLINLAITRTLIVSDPDSPVYKDKDTDRFSFRDALVYARESIEELSKHPDQAALTHLLLGRLAQAEGLTKQAIAHLQKAAETDPDDPSLWYAVYAAHADLPGRTVPFLAADAIQRASDLAPTNLNALTELVRTQTKVKNKDIVGTLDSLRTLVTPLAPTIQKQRRVDILKLLDRATGAFEKNDDKAGFRNSTMVANVLSPDLAKQIDQRRIDRNLLEYIRYEFSDDFKAPEALAEGDGISVRLLIGELKLPPLPGVSDIHITDFDLDGQPDVVLVRENRIEVYESNAPIDWKLMTSAAAPEGAEIRHVVLADLDRDFEVPTKTSDYQVLATGTGLPENGMPVGFFDTDVDVIAFGPGGIFVFRNDKDADGARSLTRIEQDDAFNGLRNARCIATTDVEHDGDLDLVIGSDSGLAYWINQSQGVFTNGDENVAMPPSDVAVNTLCPVDWNRDITNDVVAVTEDSTGLMENILHGRSRWQPLSDAGGQSAIVEDIDGNGSWDLISAGPSGITALRTAFTSGDPRTIATDVLSETPAAGVLGWDYDNDGYRDLVTWSADSLQVLRGSSSGKFKVVELFDEPPSGATACDVDDVDLDGDQDLIVAGETGVTLYMNDGGNQNNWFRLTLRPEPNPEQNPSQRVSMHGYGCVIELKSGSAYQARVVDRPVTHFGLGSRDAADAVRIIWTDGVPQNIVSEPAPDTRLTVLAPQFLKSSCPYIYTWTGEQFEFFSDCLWAAPLGLQQEEGVLAPWREWEYVRIPGAKLRPRKGEYLLQVTEELREATYLDQVKLIVVDHPAGTEIFSNEKVGPPDATEFKIHTVRKRRPPVAARDQNGRDLMPLLGLEDDKYVRAFDQRYRQGHTSEHFIELDPGDLGDPKRVTLFLVGWVVPTDTNINISISQAPHVDPPRPPSIQVVNEQGEWVETVPFAGFPGGKTKTIAIDLSDAFRSDDHRVRLVTSMELYWDAAFFAVDEEPVDVRTAEVPLKGAHLHYRGFSRRIVDGSVFGLNGNAPEKYDYYTVATEPAFPPMRGRFTKFGEVSPLLTKTDDQQVVFGAGDEITLRFEADESGLPEGWVRDFLLYNVGWDKDANQNTVLGQTVEPLPFVDMSSYPFAPDETFPDTEQHREYLRTWQTRRQPIHRFWNRVRRFDSPITETSE